MCCFKYLKRRFLQHLVNGFNAFFRVHYYTETAMSQLSSLVQPADAPTVISPNNNLVVQPLRQERVEFSSLVGQPIASYLLGGAIETHRVAPAYLFVGVDGIGKTLAAKIFSAQLLGTSSIRNHPDLIWVEPTFLHHSELVNESELADAGIGRKYPPQIRIEQIRELTQFFCCSPLVAQSKVAIITGADRMATAAANALLKTLEEPKIGTIILISSQPQKLLPTIASRCQLIPFYRLNSTEMMAVLEKLERHEIVSDPTVISLAVGSPGMAIAHYNQLQSIPHDLLTKLSQFPTLALTAMQLAKAIDEQLDYHQQQELLNYLQLSWWHRYHDVALVEKIESAKSALNKMAASRLVWEILLLPSAG